MLGLVMVKHCIEVHDFFPVDFMGDHTIHLCFPDGLMNINPNKGKNAYKDIYRRFCLYN